MLVPQVHLAQLEPLDYKDLEVMPGPRVNEALAASMVLLDYPALMVKMVVMVRTVLTALTALTVQTELTVFLGRTARMVLKDPKGRKDRKVLLDLQVLRDRLDLLVRRVRLVQAESQMSSPQAVKVPFFKACLLPTTRPHRQ